MSSQQRNSQERTYTYKCGVDRDAENSQDSLAEVHIKDEPEDTSYDQKSATPIHSDYNSTVDSRDSSPLPPVHFETSSPQPVSSPVAQSSSQIPLNDLFAGSAIRSHVQGTITSKNIVHNIIEGLLKKNETLLAMSDTGSLKPKSHQIKSTQNNSVKLPASGQSCVFPVSTNLQAQVLPGKKLAEATKTRMKRSKSPTLRHASVLKDKTNFTYALMETGVSDSDMEKMFNVQKHELVCGIGAKSFIVDQSHKFVASLDVGNYWCNFCPYTTTNKSLLVHHTLEHRFACRYCAYESFCRSDIVRHMHKVHPEFGETADRYFYCTFLSDYLRVKSKIDQTEQFDDDSDSLNVKDSRDRKRKPDAITGKKSPVKKFAKLTEVEDDVIVEPTHLVSKDSDFDIFDMEVEEIGDASQDNSEEPVSEKAVNAIKDDLSNSLVNYKDARPFPTNLVKVISSGQMNSQHSSNQPTSQGSEKKSSTKSSGRSSNLYWSCGYCQYHSSCQSEIKEHSNKEHVGKPHRYVALIRNSTAKGITPSVKKDSSLKPSSSHTENSHKASIPSSSHLLVTYSPQFSNSFSSFDDEDMNSVEDPVSLTDISSPMKMTPSQSDKKENNVYHCYHCLYSAKRQFSVKTHIYNRHKGKCLVAVFSDSKRNTYFCARDDCNFKSENPNAFMNHVNQCTPWSRPELADVEVEPHIRQCLEETLTIAKTVKEKKQKKMSADTLTHSFSNLFYDSFLKV